MSEGTRQPKTSVLVQSYYYQLSGNPNERVFLQIRIRGAAAHDLICRISGGYQLLRELGLCEPPKTLEGTLPFRISNWEEVPSPLARLGSEEIALKLTRQYTEQNERLRASLNPDNRSQALATGR